MNKIKVIDSIMGSGKTTWAINYMNNNKDKKFVYITPYLDEIKRIKDCTSNMYEPIYKGSSKTDNFHKLLLDYKNICSTHALFKNANDITREALETNEYILILDEVMNVVEEMQNFTKNDLETLLNEELASIEDDYLIWNKNKINYDGRYNDIKNMALNKSIICINDKLIFWNFPVDIFDYFKEVYILTYMFDCQIQRYYYDFHNVQYSKYQLNDEYKMIHYTTQYDLMSRKKLTELINVYNGKMNDIGNAPYSLSKNWFEGDDGTRVKIMKKNLNNWFNNINKKYTNTNRLWTTFKDYQSKVQGAGYTKRFISLNMRSTNEYRDACILAYCCNRYVKPTLLLFFSKRGIDINQDDYALSEMLQWIWRSRIRDNKSIDIYIPSKRMRELLLFFLKNK